MFFLMRCLARMALLGRKPSVRKSPRLTPFCLAHIVLHADISMIMSVACPFTIRMIFRPDLDSAGLAGILFALRFVAGDDKDERSGCSSC
jgi:hypothetical protein